LFFEPNEQIGQKSHDICLQAAVRVQKVFKVREMVDWCGHVFHAELLDQSQIVQTVRYADWIFGANVWKK